MILTFQKESFRKNIKLTIYHKIEYIMTILEKIKDEKLQWDIDREGEKISALSSGKSDKNKYVIGEEILPSD